MIRPIEISAVLNGFIMRVGCQQIVFTSVDELTTALTKYLKDPEMTEKEYLASGKAINRKHTLHAELIETPCCDPGCGTEGPRDTCCRSRY